MISTKWVHSDFGGSYYHPGSEILKMLVELEDGNRVFGSVPTALLEIDGGNGVGQGSKTFTGTVEPSKDDLHFGFFSRLSVKRADSGDGGVNGTIGFGFHPPCPCKPGNNPSDILRALSRVSSDEATHCQDDPHQQPEYERLDTRVGRSGQPGVCHDIIGLNE